jgi:hypothetical protein
MSESPSTTAQDLALGFVWDYILAYGRRPTAAVADRFLYRDRGVRENVIPYLPRTHFTVTPAPANGNVQDDALIGLTALGVRATGTDTGRRALDLVFMVIRQGADLEREHQPSPSGGLPRLTATSVSAFYGLAGSGADALLPAIGEILRDEPWGGTRVAGTADPVWEFEISREVRPLAGVTDLDDYLGRVGHREPDSSPQFNALFWTTLTTVFGVAAVVIAALEKWNAATALCGAGGLTTAVLAVHRHRHRRRLDRYTFVYCVVCAVSTAVAFWAANRN